MKGKHHNIHERCNETPNFEMGAFSFSQVKLSLRMQMVFDEVQVWNCFPLSPPTRLFPQRVLASGLWKLSERNLHKFPKLEISFPDGGEFEYCPTK